MGGCVSTIDQEGKERSAKIDEEIENDAKRFKRECKILLLGTPLSCLSLQSTKFDYHRFGRIREKHYSQADENHSQRGVYWCRAGRVSTDCVQKCVGFCTGSHYIYEENRLGFRRVFESRMFYLTLHFPYLLLMLISMQPLADKVLDYRPDTETSNTFFPPDIADAIHQLWKDPIITKIMDEHSSEFYLMDSAA